MVNRLTDQVFYIRENDDWVLKRTQDIFNDKEVGVFGLPGAFTPTCSAFQLPKFEELYDDFRDLGIDEVYCTSVNDSFVMNAWFEQQGITKVKALPDGNGDFAKSVNMINDFTNRGFGMRSWRYCMFVKNAEIKVRYTEWGEPEACPIQDPFEVSNAEKMIEALKQMKAN